MRVLLVTPEYEGLVKVGGLSDFCRAMAHALIKRGHDVRVFMPHYRVLKSLETTNVIESMTVPLSTWHSYDCSVNLYMDDEVPVYLVERDDLFDRAGIYDEKEAYFDNPLRFAFLSHASFSLCESLNWQPDILHGSDWQGAMLPFYKRIHYAHERFFHPTRTVLTIHNGAYQGRYDVSWHEAMGISPKYMVPQLFEDMGTLNMMKGGVTLADRVVTVSPAYRDELLEAPTGHGMHKIFQRRAAQLQGILNGVDNKMWDPDNDPFQPYSYNYKEIGGKRECKREFLKNLGWKFDTDTPLFASIGRVAGQKGFDLMLPTLKSMLEKDVQAVVMGHGEDVYVGRMRELEAEFPGQFLYIPDFSPKGTRRLLAASDFLLMPSLFEPCGLTQLYAMRYGSIPVVHHVGGLKSTIVTLDSAGSNRAKATGYAFVSPTVKAFKEVMERAINDFKTDHMTIRLIQRNGMCQHFSWRLAATKYEDIYRELVKRPEPVELERLAL
jgi:starch synthase